MARYLRANGAGESRHKPVSLSRNLAPARPAGLECLPECPLEGRNDPKTAAKPAGALLSNSQPGKTRVHPAKDRAEGTLYNRWAGNHTYGEARRATQSCGTRWSGGAYLEVPPIVSLGGEKFGRQGSILST